MSLKNIGEFKTINGYVADKINSFRKMDKTFESLYSLMFREESNYIFEEYKNFQIEKTTYGECKKSIESKSICLDNILGKREENSIVGIYLENSLEWIEVFWSVLKCGCRPLLINMRLDDETIERSLVDLRVNAVISSGKTFSIKTINLNDIIEVEGNPLTYTYGNELFVMSSGTTNSIKICAYSVNEIFYLIEDSFYLIGKDRIVKRHYHGELKLLTFLPFYHIFGLIAVYIWFSFFSRTFVKLNDFSPQTILFTINKHKVTHIFAVPMLWEKTYDEVIKKVKEKGDKTYNKFKKGIKIAKRIGNVPIIGNLFIKLAFKEIRDNLFGDSISFMISGGSNIKSEVLEFFNCIGYRLCNGFGMSEIAITSVEISNNIKTLSSGSVGNPLPSVSYKISDEGELLVKSKSCSKYIIQDGKKIFINDTWFNTHDLATYKNHTYFINGRKDDLVVSLSGENLNPNIIESKFIPLNVCLIKDINTNLPILLVSVPKFLSENRLNEIKKSINNTIDEINLTSQISKVIFTNDSFITDDDFKLNRLKVSDRFKNGQIKELSTNVVISGDESELNEIVKSYFKSALNLDGDISIDSDFFVDLGGTSLDYFAMTMELQNRFNISFPNLFERKLNTIREISDFIEENI